MNRSDIKRPFTMDTEYPRKCNACAQKRVVMATIDYTAEVRHDGRLYEFVVPKLHIEVCEACGEKVFTEQVDAQINHALRNHIGLLHPEEIKANLKRIAMNQKKVAESLGLAEATLSRWLNGTQIQSRAMDTLMRTFFSFPQVRQILTSGKADKSFGLVEFSS